MGEDASRSGLPCGHLQGHGDLLPYLAVLPKTATLLISKILIHTLWLTNLLQTRLFSAPCNMFCNLVLCGLLILTQLDETSAAMAQVLLPALQVLPWPQRNKTILAILQGRSSTDPRLPSHSVLLLWVVASLQNFLDKRTRVSLCSDICSRALVLSSALMAELRGLAGFCSSTSGQLGSDGPVSLLHPQS